jgi:hypothetical protein
MSVPQLSNRGSQPDRFPKDIRNALYAFVFIGVAMLVRLYALH